MQTTHKNRTTSAQKIARRRFEKGSPSRIAEREETGREMALGMKIRQIREEAGWTQQQLAEKIGTQPSAISRIEDADYDHHTVSLLERVAQALGMELVVGFQPKRQNDIAGRTAPTFDAATHVG
jgi:ribosome-binding protein aMBF1 (putative translation factor)